MTDAERRELAFKAEERRLKEQCGNTCPMSEEQKRFKIKKKESYKEQIASGIASELVFILLMGITAVSAIISLSECGLFSVSNGDISHFISNRNELMSFLIGTGWSVSSCGFLASIIEKIAKITMLKSKIEDIDNELEMAEIEENIGMRR